MPIYGYRCTQCGHELEALQNMSDPPLRVCPECMGPLQKLLYPVGVVFKGSGFYSTDYKGSKAGSNGSEGTKSESKSDPPKSDAPKPKSPDKTD
jgi:putative FmdB family regulatory protein